MTDDNSNAPQGENLVDMDNLADFKETFFKPDEPVDTDKQVEDEAPEGDEVDENEDDALATDENENEPDPDQDEEKEKPQPEKKGKKSYQERINELTAARREAERREAELQRRIEQLETRKPEDVQKPDAPKPLRQQLPADAPNPDAKDEDGEPLYRLGEFDPAYIQDLTVFMADKAHKDIQEREQKTLAQRQVEAAQEELKGSWLDKVSAAEEELPDIREKLLDMSQTFDGIQPDYGEFLAATIMSCDFGPQIMYYLSQNIGEAQKIVASGPAAATLAIGRLDAKFNKPMQNKSNTKKVSDAPKPPEARTRGSGGQFKAPADTTDLAAFRREYFKK